MTGNLSNRQHSSRYSVIDRTAAIIPGRSAAGILLGSPIESLQNDMSIFVVEPLPNPINHSTELLRYRSSDVDIWVEDGFVTQIMVHGSYSGELMGGIGINSTISDIEREIGACKEDENDNLVIVDVPGISFEIRGYFPGLADPMYRFAPIKEFYVFAEDNLVTGQRIHRAT